MRKKGTKEFSRGFICGLDAMEQIISESTTDLLNIFDSNLEKETAIKVSSCFLAAIQESRKQIAELERML